jgi:hypothetical protein
MNRIFILILATLVVWGPGLAQGQKPAPKETVGTAVKNPFSAVTQFSANSEGGFLEDPQKIYRSGNLMRVDLTDAYRVTNLDKREVWVVKPKSCSHYPAPDAYVHFFLSFKEDNVESSAAKEKETVDGHSCRIETLTFHSEDRPVVTWKLWEAEDLNGFPIKLEVKRKPEEAPIALYYKNVSLKPPDPALFKLPPRCSHAAQGPAPKSGASPKSATPPGSTAPPPASTAPPK